MIDIRKLKELVKLMVANDLSEMDLRDTDEQVTIRRQGDTVVTVPAPVAVTAPVAAPVVAPVASPVVDPAASTALVDEGVEIVSPMVGTFYVSQDPDSPPFVSVGDSVAEGSTVCVIEAMKIFNEINAQCKGTVIKVLVSNGDPVEFGQALFLVKPQ
ncbi:MAG: acetyl-CoA carboxylase biotin carboxyl carrier protein [Phycisphaerae bacterium]|jgi:acetyl-CoA carboxylase biotin carboxyl carrier protein|nr:acetyl-CoA carboxylase biotin carboxyl carrier protein [Phycisphaerae bacterium]MBT5365455.1 acetyl-CoA carboxylase biotin carboxyl carrier protein [Phycisphaerae bacterium]MBT6269434.1 acetyl-CoA carboxylase biotin carboxyl carrier protein [Phycisphaerae bacterium]MBT6282162.1 acetyl-CoA carboxylase biotin carboxyl carrier protein [Phycisphaerae bacterium]MBT7657423.1 acetyl-CoA carboxylase biotin carboxyl carrier protein [Phycisphaerae bacterium]